MPHGNTVVNGDGIELSRIAAHGFNLLFYNLANLVEVGMTGNKLRERIDDGNDRLAELFTLHTSGNPESSRSCHPSTFSAHGTS